MNHVRLDNHNTSSTDILTFCTVKVVIKATVLNGPNTNSFFKKVAWWFGGVFSVPDSDYLDVTKIELKKHKEAYYTDTVHLSNNNDYY